MDDVHLSRANRLIFVKESAHASHSTTLTDEPSDRNLNTYTPDAHEEASMLPNEEPT